MAPHPNHPTAGSHAVVYVLYLCATCGVCWASFDTVKKTRKFREWVDLTSITEFKGNDEFYEVLGYITTMITVEMLGLAKKTSPGSGTMVRGEQFIELLRRLGGRSTVLCWCVAHPPSGCCLHFSRTSSCSSSCPPSPPLAHFAHLRAPLSCSSLSLSVDNLDAYPSAPYTHFNRSRLLFKPPALRIHKKTQGSEKRVALFSLVGRQYGRLGFLMPRH